MTTASSVNLPYTSGVRHAGPPLLVPAILYAALFALGLLFLFKLATSPYTPPFAEQADILSYFRSNSAGVRLNGFFQFAASIPLGIFASTAVSRLNFLEVRAAGTTIALFGGIGASIFLAICGLSQWVMARPEVLVDASLLRAWQDIAYVTGGVGHIALTGLLLAGLSIPSMMFRLLPRALCIFGIVLAVLSEVSTLSLIFPSTTLLLLVRFPTFVWIILCGATLAHRRVPRSSNIEN
jgi:hypothetical protein